MRYFFTESFLPNNKQYYYPQLKRNFSGQGTAGAPEHSIASGQEGITSGQEKKGLIGGSPNH